MVDHDDAVWVHSERRVTLVQLSEACGLPQEVLRELVELGSLNPADPQSGEWDFDPGCVNCLRRAARLGRDLELEVEAIALALSFLQQIERLEAEVRSLRAELGR